MATVASLIIEAGDGAHTDVLVHKVFVSEIIENLVVLNTSLFLFTGLGNRVKLVLNNGVHCVEDGDKVSWWLLEGLVAGESSEFLVNTLSPVTDLVVYNVNALEALAKTLVLFFNLSELFTHQEDVTIVLNCGSILSLVLSIV